MEKRDEEFKKVTMSHEQLELLRHQISYYISLSRHLAQMHASLLNSQQHLPGMTTFGSNTNCYPLSYYDHNKNKNKNKNYNNSNNKLMMSSRKRWSPTNEQLRMLEKIFNEGHGTPTKAKIKAMTEKLSKFGPISENNVYNWFQNRRARSKKKQKPVTDVQVEPPQPPQPPPPPVPLHVECQSLASSAAPVPTQTEEDDDSLVFLNLEDLGSWPKDAALSELNGLWQFDVDF